MLLININKTFTVIVLSTTAMALQAAQLTRDTTMLHRYTWFNLCNINIIKFIILYTEEYRLIKLEFFQLIKYFLWTHKIVLMLILVIEIPKLLEIPIPGIKQFPENRFHGLWSLQRPPDRVGFNWKGKIKAKIIIKKTDDLLTRLHALITTR